jgi:hypothetical protein
VKITPAINLRQIGQDYVKIQRHSHYKAMRRNNLDDDYCLQPFNHDKVRDDESKMSAFKDSRDAAAIAMMAFLKIVESIENRTASAATIVVVGSNAGHGEAITIDAKFLIGSHNLMKIIHDKRAIVVVMGANVLGSLIFVENANDDHLEDFTSLALVGNLQLKFSMVKL